MAVIFAFKTDLQIMGIEILHMFCDIKRNVQIKLHNKIHDRDENEYIKIISNPHRKVIFLLAVSCIPTMIAGFLLQKTMYAFKASILAIGLGLLVNGILLLVVDHWKVRKYKMEELTWKHALGIGIMQGFGVIPGLSRSALTLTAGLLCGLRKKHAVKYSFLLSIPTIVGAIIYELKELVSPSMTFGLGFSFTAGTLVAAFVGFLCIRRMLHWMLTKNVRFFAWYCFAIGTLAIVCDFMI